ncbi:MAG: hypothetical protein IGQ88_00675 [Gloeomargaritaceae cyanobacterium C42_A2020_066]|nr:hypothetical protein [Gloeomargaritaceae cyanobacterium C42_A2020_066]
MAEPERQQALADLLAELNDWQKLETQYTLQTLREAVYRLQDLRQQLREEQQLAMQSGRPADATHCTEWLTATEWVTCGERRYRVDALKRLET